MYNYYLAVDIGASSGRHILGWIEDGRIQLEEIYRFENGMINRNGKKVWDHEQLFSHIKTGIAKCKENGKIPKSMGIDTWGVDFVLLDENDEVLGDMVGYRDKRTTGMDQEVYKMVDEAELYRRTGIQKQIFNTIYQLMAVKQQQPEHMEAAKTILFVPDYFHFLLTGKKYNEYTEATTGQLINPITKDWDMNLIERLGYNTEMFCDIVVPGTNIGNLKAELVEELGFDMEVIVPCTHDTGAAVLAVPAMEEDFVYISSGTWSLLGIERDDADCSELSRKLNFTNEGGYEYKTRYLKNIMGLWMIQSVRHNFDDKYSFAEICEQAEAAKDFPSRVDANDSCFLAPDNMVEEIQRYCRDSNQKEPITLGEIATVVYASLAECYRNAIREIEESTRKKYKQIHIVGGGSNAAYLNKLTADITGKEVHAGPGEATAIGNIIAQMIAYGEYRSKAEARQAVHHSFDIKIYEN